MTTTWGTEIPKPAPDPDELVALSERAVKLNALIEHPSWDELRAVMEERRDLHMRRLAKRLTSGSIDASEIDRNAGFWKGVFAVLDKPDEVEKQLETALRRAQPTEGE